ncbi:MAG TPA: hypothetical protein VKD08_06065 [Ignavibacteriaceae bacterium]|nr:hypothetical protein [Ignavibacteriaceae bacterium]
MKYLLTILFTSLLFAACSTSKTVTMDPARYDPCTQQSDLASNDVFTGETVDNVVIDQQSGLVYVTMDVRAYCSSALNMEMQQNENQITLMVSNTNTASDNCVCIKKARTAFRDLAPGTYDLRITDKTGHKLLDQESITIPE